MTTTNNTGTVMHDDAIFREACAFAGVTPTRRQVSKYRNGYGALHNAAKPLTLGAYVERCRAAEEARKAAEDAAKST